ncbi:MAG: glycosyltransferase family A protein [Tepidisphaeraceae bacterium]
MPVISVIIPMRNCEKYVEQTLRSMLAQTGVDLEIVVVNDGSTDKSADVVRALNDARIKLVKGPCQGIAAALNAGLAHATGELFCRCDADDFYEPADRLAAQTAFLQNHPEFGAVCGRYTMVSPTGKLVDTKPENESPDEITVELQSGKGRTHLNTFMVRMSIVRQLNGFRPYFIGTEDNDFQLRLSDVARIWYEPASRYVYRLHSESITHTQPTAQRKFLEKMAREFQLQRQSGRQDDLDLGKPPALPDTYETEKPHDLNNHLQDVLIGRAWKEHRAGRRGRAVWIGLNACLKRPMRLSAWRGLAALAIKRPGGAR